MKKLLLVALLAIGVSAASYAQGGPGGFGQTPEEQVAKQKTDLKLTDAQAAKLLPIYAAQAKSRDSLFQSGGGMGDPSGFQEMFKKMDAQSAIYNAKIKAILTPEQLPIFQKQLDAAAERRKQMMQNMPQN